jgi:hypothetical protein
MFLKLGAIEDSNYFKKYVKYRGKGAADRVFPVSGVGLFTCDELLL